MEYKIKNIEILPNYNLKIIFGDGFTKVFDVKPYIKDGISKELLDESFFKKVKVENDTIVWENGFDFCPVFLRKYANC